MKNLTINITNENGYVGNMWANLKKCDSYAHMFKVYDSETNSYQAIKITLELMKPKDKVKEIRKLVEEYENIIDPDYGHKDMDLVVEIFTKILDILDEINNQKS